MFGKHLGKGNNKRGQYQGPWWSQSKKLLITMCIITAIVGLLICNYISFVTYHLYDYLKISSKLIIHNESISRVGMHLKDIIGVQGLNPFYALHNPVFLPWLIFIGLGVAIVWSRVIRSYITYNSFEYGNEGFEDNKKVVKEYPRIPDRIESFDGYGGVPVLHKDNIKGKLMQLDTYRLAPKLKTASNVANVVIEKIPGVPNKQIQNKVNNKFQKGHLGKYMIDTATNNTLVIGMTRSGKGETFIFPTLDILSRAKKKCSMFINDPKDELTQASYFTLLKRGYKVVVLDLNNMYKSASYNPLQVIINYAKRGYIDQVAMEVNKFSTSIYT